MSGSKIGFNFQTTNQSDDYAAQKSSSKQQTVSQNKVAQTDEYVVKRGDTLTEIAVKSGQNLQELLQKNRQIKNPNRIYVGQRIEIGKASNIYTVKAGDTLSEIAKAKQTTVGDLLRTNPKQIGNRNLIYPGQKLNIPVTAKTNKPTGEVIQPNAPKSQTPPVKAKTPQVEAPPIIKTTASAPQSNTAANGTLHLGANEKYRDDLLFAQKLTGTDASTLAAVINAEAAKKNGVWQADSFNRTTNAGGLTQFLPKTWGEMAIAPGTYLNKIATEKGFVRQAAGGKFEITNDSQLMNLRFNPRASIVTAAEYDKKVLAGAERLGIVPKNLSSDDKAKYLYYAHHEGPGGVLTHLVDSKNVTEEQAKAILKVRLGSADRAQAKANQFGSYRAAYKDFAEHAAMRSFPQQTDKSVIQKYVNQYGSYEHGYRAWLTDYTDKNVRPQNFRQTGAVVTAPQEPTAQKPATRQTETSPTAPGSGSVKQTGMPDTGNLTAAQKFDVYADFINQNGNDKAKTDLANGKRVILGLRQPTSTKANNGIGAYDDRVVVLWKDKDGKKQVKEITNANTEPASYYEDTAANRKLGHHITKADANGDGIGDLGRLKSGTYEYTKSYAEGFGTEQERGRNILRPTTANPVDRDSDRDGDFDRDDAARNKRNTTDSATMYFHRGGRGKFTGSAGCQTMPQSDFNEFWKSLGDQNRFQYVLVTVK